METTQASPITTRLLKGSSVIFFFTLITSPLGYIIRMIFSRSLSIEEYGLIYAMLSFFALLTMVNDLGFGHAVAYYVPKYVTLGKFKVAWLLYRYDQIIEVLTSVCISGFLLLTNSFWVETFFKHESAYQLLWLFSLYLIANGVISSIQNLLVGLQKENQYSVIEFVRLGFTFVFSLFFFLSDITNILWYASAFVLGYILVAAIFIVYIQRFKVEKVPLLWKPALIKKSFTYAIPTFFATSLFILINYTDMIFLTAFQSIEQVGLYNIIFPVISVAILLLEPMRIMLVPLISELHEENRFSEISILVNQLLIVVPVASVYFLLFIFLFPEGVISLLFGSKWVDASSHLLQFMALGYMPLILMTYLTSIVSGIGRVKERLSMSVVLAVVSLMFGSVGAFMLGIMGIIIANVVVYMLSIGMLLYILKKDIRYSIPFVSYLALGVVWLVFYWIRHLFEYVPVSTIDVLITGGLYSILFAVVMIITRLIDIQIINQIFQYIRPQKNTSD
ncbi:MAG: oligosaccharide flippase family protein [Microgenomates group bacterium]